MAYDKKAFLSGMAMGLTGKGNPVSGAVGMYSYNGTMFPAVPVYDPSNPMEEGYTSECPYTVITNTPSGYYCYLTNYPLLHVDSPSSALAPSEIVSVHSFLYVDGEWQYKDSFMMAKGFTQLVVEPIWANYDILNEDESVYLAASDPTPDTFSKGYLVGAKLRAKRVLPKQYLYGHVAREGETPTHTIGGVGYVGAVLSDINAVWTDKEAYPYASVHDDRTEYFDSNFVVTVATTPWEQDADAFRTWKCGACKTYGFKNGVWELWGDEDWSAFILFPPYNIPIWTNTPILYTNGTIYLEAAEPILM